MFKKILLTIAFGLAIIIGIIAFYGKFQLAYYFKFASALIVVGLCGKEIYKIWKSEQQ